MWGNCDAEGENDGEGGSDQRVEDAAERVDGCALEGGRRKRAVADRRAEEDDVAGGREGGIRRAAGRSHKQRVQVGGGQRTVAGEADGEVAGWGAGLERGV